VPVLVYEDNTNAFLAFFKGLIGRGLDRVGRQAVALARDRVSFPSPPPSFPGEYPHSASGLGKDSIDYRVQGHLVEIFVHPEGVHMEYLQEGTEHVEARPWMSLLLDEYSEELGREFSLEFR
jgi:hypothetical protein